MELAWASLWKPVCARGQGKVPGMAIWNVATLRELSHPSDVGQRRSLWSPPVTLDTIPVGMTHTESLQLAGAGVLPRTHAPIWGCVQGGLGP